MLGPIEKYLLEKIKAEGSIHITLIDPEKVTAQQAANIAENSKNSGTAAIMIGGSTFASQAHLDNVVKSIKVIRETSHNTFSKQHNGNKQLCRCHMVYVSS